MKMIDEQGVSEVIGAVLLVSLAVLGVAIVAVALFSQPPPSEIPHVSVVAGTTADNTTFVLLHEGGDALAAGNYRIYVDNGSGLVDRTTEFSLAGDDIWSIGENLTYTGGGTPERVVISVVDSGGGETVIAEPYGFGVAAAGAYADAGGSGSVTPVVTVTPGPTPTPEPSIIIIEPPIGDPFNLTAKEQGNGRSIKGTVEGNITSEDVTRVDLVIYPYNDPSGSGTKEVTIYRDVAEGRGIFSQEITFTGNTINDGDPITLVFLLYNDTSLLGVDALKTEAHIV
ncbi:type IV pilin N-terminal domain-containing protein [Methanofollis tationis]|uniref:Type IV pilin N-terminal domain-containing protein n=1 Tax=Methanofollis tationis TaxID=81417 RepID=A0A7K4HM38_9EURY|nr:type IV pilin N-terminal domain-containing protein [Methanofollis tationis]NVO65948.1 type IV pilin N-terminal domain-containing protein [Methanofollis tationis]